MAFEFHCRACGAKLRIDDDLAGQDVKCPSCGAVVPAADALEGEPDGSLFAGIGSAPSSTDEANPYASPASLPDVDTAEPAAEGPQAITPGIHRAMSETRPWVSFLSILAFLLGALMAVGSVSMVIVAIVLQDAPILFMAALYLFYGGFVTGFGYYLFRYAKAIRVFNRNGRAAHLEAALVAQKSFWKLLGIFAAILLALMLVAVIVAAILPPLMMGM